MPEQAREIPEPKAARVGHGPSAGTDTRREGTARGDAASVLRLLRFITEMEMADPIPVGFFWPWEPEGGHTRGRRRATLKGGDGKVKAKGAL